MWEVHSISGVTRSQCLGRKVGASLKACDFCHAGTVTLADVSLLHDPLTTQTNKFRLPVLRG